jgi:ribosome recycling factor
MSKEILQQSDKRMGATIADFKQRLTKVRTGRASLAIFDGITLDYYGTPTPLAQVAKLSIPEPTLIVAQPFDPAMIRTVEKSIMSADLGLNPSNDGKVIRVPIPPLTEERRKQMVKKVHQLREDAKTAVRQVRREANEELKKAEKAGESSEDDSRRDQGEVQKITDKHTDGIDEICKRKEKELLEV